jgi:diguanylate cyclase (GGDEF)-like protein
MLGEARFQLGYLLGMRGDYANGLAQLRQAERLFEKLGKPLHQLSALNAIAILYNRIGEYSQAQQMYERALAAQGAPALQRDQAVMLSNLGRADENLHDWKAAQEAYTKCLEISTQIDYPRAQGYALRGIAAVANATGDPAGALTTLEQADALLAKTPDARLHALIQLERGVALHRLAHLPEAATALEDAARIFTQADARAELSATYSELASVYAASGNWRAAYERQTKAKSLSDQLLRNQIDLRFAALKVEFDTAAKEKENAALKHENEAGAQALVREHRVRQLQFAVIVLMVLVALLAAVLSLLQLRATRRLRVLAMTDELTRVPNRRAVLMRLATLLSSSELPASILILDIDHFKTINDHHGHPAGDEVLKVVAQTLQAAVAPPAYFGRLGGEEFLIVLPATDLAGGRAVAERLRELVASTQLMRPPEERRRITASIGVATATPKSDTPSTLLRRADTALYAAKHGGRNCVMTEPADPEQELAL